MNITKINRPTCLGPEEDSKTRDSFAGARCAAGLTVVDSNERAFAECKGRSWTSLAVRLVAILLATLFAGTAFAQIPAKRYNPDLASNNPYGLIDLDNFAVGSYGYCKWGNLMSKDSDILPYTKLTQFKEELYLNAPGISSILVPVGVSPESQGYQQDAANLRYFRFNSGTPFPLNHALMRKLHFQNSLTNYPESAHQRLSSANKKLIILIHGWNQNSNPNSYDNAEFNALASALYEKIQYTEWRLVLYHWEADADTGLGLPAGDAIADPIKAAEIAHQHGQHLGELIHAISPQLQKVHFIAHSAGSWAARSATRYLLQNTAVKVQVTLLDPFIPGELANDTSLTKYVMSAMPLMDPNNSGQLSLLENYYAVDRADVYGWGDATSVSFGWNNIIGIQRRIDWGDCYKAHEGPIQFYADTVKFVDSPLSEICLENEYFELSTIAWKRSMFYCETPGAPLNLTAAAFSSSQINLSWTDNSRNELGFKIERAISANGPWTPVTTTAANVSAFSNAGRPPNTTYYYRVRAYNAVGGDSEWSNVAHATTLGSPASNDTTSPAAPVLSVSPNPWSNRNLFLVSWTDPPDPSGIARVWWKIGSAPSSSTDGSPLSVPQFNPFPVGLLQGSGVQTIYVWLEDGMGNESYLNRASATLRFDPNPPSIAPTINPVSTSVSSSISVNGTASDDLSGIAGVTWANDLGLSGSANVVNNGLSATWSVPSIQLASGANHITFTATDIAGNTSRSTVTVNYYNGTANNSGSVQVTITPPSANSAGAQWRFAGEALWHQSGEVVNSYTGTRTINFAPADGWTPPPDNNVTMYTGQTTPLAVNYTVPISLQPPYVPSLPYPVHGAADVPRSPLTLSWLGGSPNGSVTYALALDTNPNVIIATAPIGAGYGGINGSSFTVIATLQPATTYYWRVYTKDHNNNVTIGPVWSFTTQYVIPDLVPSNLSIDGNISPGSTVTAQVTVMNQGSFTAQGAYVNLYLSRTRGAKEAQLNPIASLPLHLPAALAPGQSVTLSGQVALNSLQTGQSFIDAWINSSPWGASAESDYNNNTTSLAISYIDGSPPTVSYFAPQNAFAKTGSPMTFVVQATDDDRISTLDFYYSVDGGTTWTPIQEGYAPTTSPANGIAYSWTVPTTLPVGGNLLLRVVATDPSGNFGEKTTGPYVIHDGTAPTVTLTSPNGGEMWNMGSPHSITWTMYASNPIWRISLSFIHDGTEEAIQGTVATNAVSFDWTLPSTLTTTTAKVKIRIWDINGNKTEATSAGFFTITDPSQPPPAPWNAAVAVTSAATGDPAGLPRIVADSTGTLHLIYGLSHNATAHTISFRYRKRIGTIWTSPSVVSFDVTTLDNQIGLSYDIEFGRWRFAVDSNAHPHLVWATSFNFFSEESKNDVFYTSFDGANWATPQNISSSIRSPLMANSIAWTRKADIPFASSASAAAAVGGKLYFIYYEQIYEYDPVANSWTRKADAPSAAVGDGGATVVNNLIYAAGNSIDGNIRIYNPSANSWSTGAAMPSPQQGVRLAAAANGMVYAIGGNSSMTRMYNPGANSWTTLADMPTARSYPAVAAVGAKVYVIGGHNQQQSMDVYDTVGNTWTTKAYPFAANIPPSFGGFAAVANNKIYFVPGMPYGPYGGTFPSRDVWEYDPATGGWTRMLPTQFGHGVGCGAAMGSKLYVLGGYDGFNDVWAMEEATISTDFAGTASSSPQVAVDAANAVHVLWNDGRYLQPDGSAFSSFSSAGEGNVYEAVKNGAGWSSPVQVTTGGVQRHAVVADQSGNLHLSYQSYSNDIAYSQRIGGSWSAPVFAGVALSASYGLDMAVDSTMKIHVLYGGYNSQTSLNILNYITLSGTSWSPPERVSSIQNGLPPRLCLDSLNRPHAIWEGGSLNPQVLYSTKIGGGWVAPIQLNRASENPVYGSVDAALRLESNELDVVWLSSNPGNPNVLLNYANVGSTNDIFAPSVSVTAPALGANLSIGSIFPIQWSATVNTGVTTVSIHYSTNNGSSWILAATNQANSGTFAWLVPNLGTNAGHVRVTARDAAGNSGAGFSGTFTTTDLTPPTITITAPTNGATVIGNATNNVVWIATDNAAVARIDLEYSLNNGASWSDMATNLTNGGFYPWLIPNSATTVLLIRATARDTAGLSASATTQPITIVRANTPPMAPNSPFPLDGSTFILTVSPQFSWSSADLDGDPLTYQIRFGTNATPPIVSSGSGSSFAPGFLRPQKTYYWQVIASDGKATTNGPLWSFTTEAGVLPATVLADHKRLTNGLFQFRLNGLFGESYSVQASTNLTAWQTLTNFINTNANTLFLDTAATSFPRRFYRAVMP